MDVTDKKIQLSVYQAKLDHRPVCEQQYGTYSCIRQRLHCNDRLHFLICAGSIGRHRLLHQPSSVYGMFPILEVHLRHHTYKVGGPWCHKEVATCCEATPLSLLTLIPPAVQIQVALLDTHPRQHSHFRLASAASHCTNWATVSIEHPLNMGTKQRFQPVSKRCEQLCWTNAHFLKFISKV